jgi:hypothetical protein
MAVSITPVFATGKDSYIADVTATADGDTTATITHNLGAVPQEVTLTNLIQAPAAVSDWAWTASPTANTITLTKGTGVGSGNAGAQVRVIVRRPHTIGR